MLNKCCSINPHSGEASCGAINSANWSLNKYFLVQIENIFIFANRDQWRQRSDLLISRCIILPKCACTHTTTRLWAHHEICRSVAGSGVGASIWIVSSFLLWSISNYRNVKCHRCLLTRRCYLQLSSFLLSSGWRSEWWEGWHWEVLFPAEDQRDDQRILNLVQPCCIIQEDNISAVHSGKSGGIGNKVPALSTLNTIFWNFNISKV